MRLVMSTVATMLLLALSIGIAAADGARRDLQLLDAGLSTPSCRNHSLKYCPRPLAARDDRVDFLDGSRHYHGGFNVRSDAYNDSVLYAAAHVLAPLSVAFFGLAVVTFISCLHPRIRASLAREFPYRRRSLIILASLSVLLSVISFVSLVSFAVVDHWLYSTARGDMHSLVTSSTLQANQGVLEVAGHLNSSVYFLTKLDNRVSNTTATTSNSTRELVAMILGAQMRLAQKQPWNKQTPRVQQYAAKHIFVVRWDIFWSRISVAVTFVLLFCGFGMVLGRLYNPRWTWTRSSPYLIRSQVPLGFLTVAMLFTAALHRLALTKMFADGVDALKEYGPPFNTTFDYRGFLPCAELSRIGNRALSDVQEALAFIHRDGGSIHVSMRQGSRLVHSAFSSEVDVMLVNASISLAASVPKIEKLSTCYEILRFTHKLAGKHGPRLKIHGKIAWISLTVAASTFIILPFLWGITRNMERPELELPSPQPRPPAPPSADIPAQPELVYPRPPVYYGPEDCPRVRQVDIWTDFFWNRNLKTPVPVDD